MLPEIKRPSITFQAMWHRVEDLYKSGHKGRHYILVTLRFHRKESMVMSSRNATRYDFDRVVDAFEQSKDKILQIY